MNWLHLKNSSIYEQLLLEEALLRHDPDNWCIVSEGTTPAIVMGISAKPHEVIDQAKVAQDKIPVIKRFSGGGTVFVDHNTLFVTFIFDKSAHSFPAFPEKIMRWSGSLYEKALSLEGFHLRENDYVIHEKKCGGNAQYIRKERWLHHTSFLWDYEKANMSYLLYPPRTPEYRKKRPHEEFLCKLSNHFPSKQHFLEALKSHLKTLYPLKEISPESLSLP